MSQISSIPLLCVLGILIVAGASCASNRDANTTSSDSTITTKDVEHKYDAPLRMRVAELESQSSDNRIRLLLRVEEPVEESYRDQLVEAGLEVSTVAGDIMTASGPVGAVRTAASLPFVIRLSLAQKTR